MSETRKIAAILVADVVGYSRLADADEDLTLARLRALRNDLIDPTIAVHNGRVFKRAGDGALVEFRMTKRWLTPERRFGWRPARPMWRSLPVLLSSRQDTRKRPWRFARNR